MYRQITTLSEFVLSEEKKIKNATGNFSLLINSLDNAGRIIASHVKRAGLVDILGPVGKKNIFADEVQKLDEFADLLIAETLRSSGLVHGFASEERESFEKIKNSHGDYVVFFDPLDGSSNIDVNMSIGTIFSIYKKSNNLLQKGISQVAAGFFLYGPSVIFIYCAGGKVNGFTLDPEIGSFVLTNPNIKIPLVGPTYTINESYYSRYPEYIRKYLSHIKERSAPLTQRYAAAMVADVYRILLKGGIFLYPEDRIQKEGKLRLLYEVNPMAYIINHAGGSSFSQGSNPLEMTPTSLHMRLPIVLGSKSQVAEFEKFYHNENYGH